MSHYVWNTSLHLFCGFFFFSLLIFTICLQTFYSIPLLVYVYGQSQSTSFCFDLWFFYLSIYFEISLRLLLLLLLLLAYNCCRLISFEHLKIRKLMEKGLNEYVEYGRNYYYYYYQGKWKRPKQIGGDCKFAWSPPHRRHHLSHNQLTLNWIELIHHLAAHRCWTIYLSLSYSIHTHTQTKSAIQQIPN